MIEDKEDADVDVFEEAASGVPTDANRDWIKLPAADLLSVEEADQLLRWRPANLVSLIGERGCGKTTLITEIYERFLRGPFAGQLFSYSQTLLGFERKSHKSRAESGHAKPDTARTSAREGLRFFHLGLVSEENARRMDLLISERAGETYREARDNPADSVALLELARARTLVFTLDGARIANDMTRAEAFASTRSMIRAFSDAGAISAGAEVQLVTTKFDLLTGGDADDARHALTKFEERLTKSYADRFAKISIWRVAARDPKNLMKPAWGVPPVLQSWLEPPNPAFVPPPVPELHDEFDRLLLRRPPNR